MFLWKAAEVTKDNLKLGLRSFIPELGDFLCLNDSQKPPMHI